MCKSSDFFNIDNSRSYATEENLNKALAKLPDHWRCVTVCNREGRFTAVFNVGSLQGDLAGPARAGFMVIG